EGSLKATEDRIARYSSVRLGALIKNPDLLRIAEPEASISAARTFWIEVGKASGMDRHQVEFSASLAPFFGEPVTKRVDLTLRSKTNTWNNRPLSYKKTTFNVEIWRLGMP